MESSSRRLAAAEPVGTPSSSLVTDQQRLAVLRAVAELRHPHLAPVRRSPEMGFELEAGAGTSLAEISRDGPLPLRFQVRLLLDALSGLAALHQARINGRTLSFVHGEFAPQNILVGRDGIARLIPLVKSHWMAPPVPSPESLGYVAPERLLGDGFDQRADIFSAGVLLWEAIAGRGLFGSLKMDAIVTQLIGSKVFRPAPPADAPWGAALADVAMQAIAVEAADRWPQVGVMGAEIETITEGCLASSEEIAQLLRRRAQGEAHAPVEVLPVARVSKVPSERPPVLADSSSTLMVRSRPSVPDLGDGVISWSGPRSARQQSWENEPGIETESMGLDEADEPRLGPRPSTMGWAAVGFGVLSAIAAFLLLKREPSSDVVAESKPVATQIVLAPKIEEAPVPPAHNQAATPPPGRQQVAQPAVRSAPTRPSIPPRAVSTPAPPGRSSAQRAGNVSEPLAAPPLAAPVESAEPPAPKPKEDLFGI